MVDDCNRLVVEIKQGEARGFGFTIQQKVFNTETQEYELKPFDLTGMEVHFQVKIAPYFNLPSLIDKIISETSSEVAVGLISYPTEGKFKVQITEQEALRNPYDYALIITVVDKDTKYIISGEGNTSGIFRVCKQ
jgi:hypothetical protein